MSEIQTNKIQPSDFARTLNSMMDNLENVVVTFQNTLLVMLEKIEKLESLEKSSRADTAPNEKEPNTKEMEQLANNATTSAEMPHQEPSQTYNVTEMTTNAETNLQQPKEVIQGSPPATVRKSGISSKPNYARAIGVALTVLGIVIIRLYFMLFS